MPTEMNLTSDALPSWLAAYLPFAQRVLLAAVILFGAWVVGRWLRGWTRRRLERRNVDPALRRYLAASAGWVVLLAGLASALDAAGVPATSFLAVLGSAGLAVGLAMQGNLSQIASGLMLLLFRPFTVGDVVSVAGIGGRVEDIGLLHTVLVTPDQQTVFVPNNGVLGAPITNHTRLGIRRALVTIGVAYGTDLDTATEVLLRAAGDVETVLEDPPPQALVTAFGASAIEFTVACFARPEDFVPMQDAVRRAILRALAAADIEVPFDQIVVHRAAA